VPFYSDTIRELLQMHVRKRPPDITRIRSGLPEGLVEFINGTLIKRPDERLTDWSTIRRLLSGPASGADVRSAACEHELISVRYDPSAGKEVGAAVEGLLRSLSRIDGVDVFHGRMVNVSNSDGSTATTAAPPESTLTT